jgi:hypothetical protein
VTSSAPTVLKTDRKTDQGYRTPEYREDSMVYLRRCKRISVKKTPKKATHSKKKDTLDVFLRKDIRKSPTPKPCVCVSRDAILGNLEDRWIHNITIDDILRRILCIGSSTDMNSVFEFEQFKC